MIVRLDADAEPTVVDADRFDRLHAVAAGPLDAMRLGDAARAAGADHVWLDVAWLRAAAAAATTDVDLDARFDAMLAVAAEHGWLDATATSVRAHLEHGS